MSSMEVFLEPQPYGKKTITVDVSDLPFEMAASIIHKLQIEAAKYIAPPAGVNYQEDLA
jgi:hypothetical protein